MQQVMESSHGLRLFRLKVACVTIAALAASGCAEMTHLTRTRELGSHKYILIDAKQRAISTYNNVSCAEPSPDALSAIAASQGLNISTAEGTSVGQSLAIAESAGSIGLRTQSIQLLRDHMYRVCESAQAGHISPFMVQLLHRRFQTTTVAILAIEQLTGTIRAPAVVLGGSSDIGNAEAVVKLVAMRETQSASNALAQTELAARTSEAATANADVITKQQGLVTATAGGDATAITTAQSALNAAKEKAAAANAALVLADSRVTQGSVAIAAIDRGMSLAQATGSASANGTIETIAHNPGDVAAVASAVEKIVEGTFGLSNTPDFCAALLAAEATTSGQINQNSGTFQACLTMLGSGGMALNR